MILLNALLPLFFLYSVKILIDATTASVGDQDPVVALEAILPVLVFVTGIAILQAGSTALARLAQEAHGASINNFMIGMIQNQAGNLDLMYFDDTSYRNLRYRARREAPTRPARILMTVLDIGSSVFSLIAMIGLLISFSWLVLPILLAAALPGGIIRLVFAGRLYRLNVDQSDDSRRASYLESLSTSVPPAQEVRLLGLTRYAARVAGELRQTLRRQRLAITKARLRAEFFAEAVAVIAMFSVVGALAYQAIAEIITLGSLVMYFQALQRCWSNFGQLVKSSADLREHSLFIEDVYRFLELSPSVKAPSIAHKFPAPMKKGITFDNVSFRYPGTEDYALRNLSMTIKVGETVAIVGHNGSGKSTLLKLLCRFYDPTEGVITVDDIDLREFEPAEIRRQFSVHLQGFTRFQDTVTDNIRYGAIDDNPSAESVRNAAVISGADAFIRGLPQKYNTMLGKTFQGGEELSGGQWQAIALARTFIREAPIIVLDEPSAHLDIETSLEIIRKLGTLTSGKTAIIISHRLSAIIGCDKIFVLDSGRLVESGSHEDLVSHGGRYAQLFDMEKNYSEEVLHSTK